MYQKKYRIKFCGITNKKDAKQAALLGVDAIGFVFFADSPVVIDTTAAADIVRELPPFISTVALCVNHDSTEVNNIINTVQPHYLQFHGDETPDFCDQFNKPYIKAIRVKNTQDIIDAEKNYPNACALLLDTYKKGIYGGTGTTFNWAIIPKNISKPIIIAGGLNPDNVNEAIKQCQPWGVDVSSKIAQESNKRQKNFDKMQQFITEVIR